MIKELTSSLHQLNQEKENQNKEIEKLNAKNWQLEQEKERLEKFLRDMHSKETINNEDRINRKTVLAEKLENLRFRSQLNKNTNQNSYYCRIAPSMNIFSDSDHSVSEEDSLEKDKRTDIVHEKSDVLSPKRFTSGISGASKSTPIKKNVVNQNGYHNLALVASNERHSEIDGNLTQDLKDIHNYINGEHDRSFINETSIIDWEMSQPSLEDSRDKIVNEDILQGKEDPDDETTQLCSEHCHVDNDIASSILTPKTIAQSDHDSNKLKSDLIYEKEKYDSLTHHIARLFEIVNGSVMPNTKQIPICSGDQPDHNETPIDPVKQICFIQGVFEDKKHEIDKNVVVPSNDGSKSFRSRFINMFINKSLKKSKKSESDTVTVCKSVDTESDNKIVVTSSLKKKPFSDSCLKSTISTNNNLIITNQRSYKKPVFKQLTYSNISMELYENANNNRDLIDDDRNDLNIFKSLSEASIRLLTEIVNNLYNIDAILSDKKIKSGVTDNTSLVMDYLQYLISLKYIDFSIEDTKRHPIYNLIKDLEFNVKNLLNKLSSKETSIVSIELEAYYQDQLNKCYDDTKELKKQLENSQQRLDDKIPVDTTEDHKTQMILIEDYITYIQDNFILFEANQKLQEELKCVDREYSKQMTRERKRLEESEAQYNNLLLEYENMQKKYIDEITGFNLSIEHLKRQHENDKRFIDQQHFEWELERSQHTVDIDNLNRTIGRIKKSSSYSDNLSDCGESPAKGKFKKSNSLPKSQSPNSENDEDLYFDASSQTIHHTIIITEQLSRKDLENVDEFIPLLKDIKENDRMLLRVIDEISDVIFEIVNIENMTIQLPNLLELSEKDLENIPSYCDPFWENIKTEIYSLKEFLINFMKEGRFVMRDYDRVREELECSMTNVTIKQGQIHALEDEVHSLMEFQKNLTNDYELLQSMLEEKQIELDNISNNILPAPTIEEYEVKIKKFQKEISDKQNIINERDEDLYVLKEEKEIYEQEKHQMQKHYDANMENYKNIYQNLECELNECQRANRELHEQFNDFIIREDDNNKTIEEKENIESTLKEKILDLLRDSESMQQVITSLTDENNLSQLRLHELEHQHKNNLEKLNKNLEETERMNRELMHCKLIRNENFSSKQSQTDSVLFDLMCNNDYQEKLLTTIDRLRTELRDEKEKCDQIETKHRQFVAQYDILSNKIFSLETSARDPKFLISGDRDFMNESIESFDRNTFLHASQISLQSFEEDMELNHSSKPNQDTLINGNFDQFRSIGCQTISDVSQIRNYTNFSVIDGDCGISISDWLSDLLNEVENVLQSCVIGDDISAEVLAKVTKFRNLLEQMYKRQLKLLLDKISCLDRDLQIERKNNLELSTKSNFLMTEVQESESVQRNLKIRMDQVLAENNRISEIYRTLSDKSRSSKVDMTEQINKFKDELESEKYKFNEINRQFKSEQRRREQLENALSIANERTQQVELDNSELIKKSRQQTDFQQKEMDTLNAEYADMFRRCNENKLQLETLQQNLRIQTMETEKTKHELRETIQSNTEYRTKMNEFIKIYQGKRSKLEIEAKELHQLLQISCRREITFIKENENLRMKVQSSQNVCKENERKIKELENFISDLHQRHEVDRCEWLKMINGSIDKKKDDSVLSQVNWLLRMLQLRIELLGLHYTPSTNYGSVCNNNGRFECVSNNGNTELVMLLQSIKAMQSMISVYLNNNQDMSTVSCGHSSDSKMQYSSRSDRQQSSFSKRPKPTGSSDSLDSLSETCSNSNNQERIDNGNNMESINTKIYVLQMNKIVELQLTINRHEKWRQCLVYQKKFILSRISLKLRSTIEKQLLTDGQKEYIKSNYFRFKFKGIALVIIALRRFSKPNKQFNSDFHATHYLAQAAAYVPYPMFSTDFVDRKVIDHTCDELVKKDNNPSQTRNSIGNVYSHINSPSVKKLKFVDESVCDRKSMCSTNEYNNRNGRQENLTNPIHCVSPILERSVNQAGISESSSLTRSPGNKIKYNIIKPGLSSSYNNPLQNSLKSSLNHQNVVSSLDRNIVGKTVNLSKTIRQIDDFGKRLDKYTDRSGSGR